MARPEHEPTHDVRRREMAYAHWHAQITRGGIDARTLQNELRRALADSEVQSDPILAGMIRAFGVQRANELAQNKPKKGAASVAHVPASAIQTEHIEASHADRSEDVRNAVTRLVRQFDEYAARLYEAESRAIFDRLRELREQYPQSVSNDSLEHCQAILNGIADRRARYQSQLDELAEQAIASARAGDHDRSSSCLRRLSSIHTAQPQLLPEDRLNDIREAMSKAGSAHDHHVVIETLIAREKSLATEIKELAASVHRFHHIARTTDHGSPEYREAEQAYRETLRAYRTHDRDWLAGVILELVDILGEWTHPPPRVEAQLDRFVADIRSALAHIRQEIGEIESDRDGAPD
ncbi:MAG: hypothetical protein KF841_10550 [Phycisphaerae bacterium]|nr:hypothetical protein [Phycisphaerae bacterium]